MSKALVLGATGAMGKYLVPELLQMGWLVDAVSLDDINSDNKNLNYIKANALDLNFLTKILKNNYDAIVDFLIYPYPDKFEKHYKNLFLNNTNHYIFFSSYRIYANSPVITENSPRLLEVTPKEELAYPYDYAIYKALEEDMLRQSGKNNWTILRPAITYSRGRYQLVTLEALVLIRRMLQNKTVLLPSAAKNCLATMSWAGDVAKMIAKLLLNPRSYGETFTVSTAEHHTWQEIADIYSEIGGLKYEFINTEDFINIWCGGSIYGRWQLYYDRCFNRVIDNSKILKVTGLKQSNLMPLKEGLKRELAGIKLEDLQDDYNVNLKMDQYIKAKKGF